MFKVSQNGLLTFSNNFIYINIKKNFWRIKKTICTIYKNDKSIIKQSKSDCKENKSENDLLKILSQPKPKISISKKKLKELEKDFRELRHKFSKEEIDKFRKSFYNIKNHRNIYTSEIKGAEKNRSELGESIMSIKSFDDGYNDENRDIDGTRRLFDVLKSKETDNGFDGRRNNYIEYKSEGDDYKDLSPEEYLDN